MRKELFILFIILTFEFNSQAQLNCITLSDVDTTYEISDKIQKINSEDLIYHNKDSSIFLYNSNKEKEQNLVLSVFENQKWKTYYLPNGFLKSNFDITYNDFNNDSVPEIVFKIVYTEHITYGDNYCEFLAIFDYHKMAFLLYIQTFNSTSHYSYEESTESWKTDVSDLFELPIIIDNDNLIIGNAKGEDDYSKINAGVYKYNDKKWCLIK